MKRILILLAVVGCLGTVDCGHRYTVDEVFPIRAGEHWTMRDQNGNFTYFEVLARPSYQACQTGTFLDLRISKSATNAYWAVGVPGAVDDFILMHDQGSWRTVTNLITATAPNPYFPVGIATDQVMQTPGKAAPYFLLPPKMAIRAGKTISIDTEWSNWDVWGQDQTSCVTIPNRKPSTIPWRTDTYVQNVDTPVYHGPAVVTYFCEGKSCYNQPERWVFAPGIGLVEIVRNNTAAGQIIAKRIN